MEFAKRMDRFGLGVFSMLARMKQERLKEGKEIVDLSIGAPNIPPAPHIRKIAAVAGDQSCVAGIRAAYEKGRNLLCDGFGAIGWKFDKPEATMFVLAEIPDQFKSLHDFVRELFERTGVLVTQGSAFGPSGEGYMRMAFVQDEEAVIGEADAVKPSGILLRGGDAKGAGHADSKREQRTGAVTG